MELCKPSPIPDCILGLGLRKSVLLDVIERDSSTKTCTKECADDRINTGNGKDNKNQGTKYICEIPDYNFLIQPIVQGNIW